MKKEGIATKSPVEIVKSGQYVSKCKGRENVEEIAKKMVGGNYLKKNARILHLVFIELSGKIAAGSSGYDGIYQSENIGYDLIFLLQDKNSALCLRRCQNFT